MGGDGRERRERETKKTQDMICTCPIPYDECIYYVSQPLVNILKQMSIELVTQTILLIILDPLLL